MGEHYIDEPENTIRFKADADLNATAGEMKKLNAEIDNLKQTIRNAEAALDSAEQDMDEILASLTY